MPKRHGKKYQEALKKVEEALSQNGDAGLEPLKAVEVARDTSTAKFDATVEAHVRLGIDVRHADQQLRSAVTLPRGTGKNVRVAVFAARCVFAAFCERARAAFGSNRQALTAVSGIATRPAR